MAKGVQADEIIASIRATQGDQAAKDFANRLKVEGGIDVTLTVAKARRKRKHRWGSADGVVIAVRLPGSVNAILEARVQRLGLTKGEYVRLVLERELTRSHHGAKKVDGGGAL